MTHADGFAPLSPYAEAIAMPRNDAPLDVVQRAAGPDLPTVAELIAADEADGIEHGPCDAPECWRRRAYLAGGAE